MRRSISFRWLASVAIVLAIVATACGNRPTDAGRRRGSPSSSGSTTEATVDATDYDPSLFDEDSDAVDNPWFPLVPGTRYVWRGGAFNDDGVRVKRRVVFVVTDLVKVIDGVTAVIGWDRDYDNGSVDESELTFYAQDTQGNVWHLGELVEHWEEGELRGIRTWFVDSPDGATPGIQMLAEPVKGARYSQGFAPRPWFWQDHAKVSDVQVRTCVPVGCFEDTIVTEEFEPRFPGEIQLKYYAPGVGGVRVGWAGMDEEREVMVLTSYDILTDEQMDSVRERVLAQEGRAYAYAGTDPATPR